MIFRMIAAKWAGLQPDSFEGEFTYEELLEFNRSGYNVYYYPNHPSDENAAAIPNNPRTGRKRPVKASDVDVFNYCFVDLDMKDYLSDNADRRHEYETKEQFINVLVGSKLPPTTIVDSGGGVHAYWKVTDLDAMSFLRLQRRLCRLFRTDPAVSSIKQLMRLPNTVNVKIQDDFKLCETVSWEERGYDCETLAGLLPPIDPKDEQYCVDHYDRCFNLNAGNVPVSEGMPKAFLKLVTKDGDGNPRNPEVHRLFYGPNKDRSSADYRLAHVLHGIGMSKDDALSVFFNTSKAAERTKVHRYNYAKNIVDKVWIEAEEAPKPEPAKRMARSVKDIMASETSIERPRFRCHEMIDATDHGFRLSEVMGMIGGSGNGKTTTALNLFAWFSEFNNNNKYVHLFVSLEQPEDEIAVRWKTMAKSLKTDRPDVDWDETVYILGNYDEDGTYRELGLKEIQEHVIQIEKDTGKKVGCVVIDHIGVLKQTHDGDEFTGLMGNCKRMKSFAVATNTFLVMQSQTSRAKNGGGDAELDMDAAYGTSQFEFYCDYIMTTWQPLKRILDKAPDMTVLCYKMAKVRKKNALKDKMKADIPYAMMFDTNTERLRPLTSDEYVKYDFWNKQATKLRNRDRKKEPSQIKHMDWVSPAEKGKSNAKAT